MIQQQQPAVVAPVATIFTPQQVRELQQLADFNAAPGTPTAAAPFPAMMERQTRLGMAIELKTGRDVNTGEAAVLIDRHRASFAFHAVNISYAFLQTERKPAKPYPSFDKLNPTTYKNLFENPNTFKEVWDHDCPWQK